MLTTTLFIQMHIATRATRFVKRLNKVVIIVNQDIENYLINNHSKILWSEVQVGWLTIDTVQKCVNKSVAKEINLETNSYPKTFTKKS